ncbi:unnamed protein product [Spirodela intermedia]|uniref:Uncharacterized protein n=1 Tax=Spirodela intermedia TaxID=51605 RepID=A0A7I8JER1_SPIIN|nr:unnamed protein product [Spirodela intermedia]CAA6668245.1 unnamed protein product [Spirodela intermedia]
MTFELVRQDLSLILVSAVIQAESQSVKVLTVVFDLAGDIPDGVRRLKMAIEKLDVGLLINNGSVCYDGGVPQMIRKKKGAIVNLGSGSVVITPSYPMFTVYTGTKSYVDSLSRSLHHSAKNMGFTSNTPSYIVTKMVPDKKPSFFNTKPEEYAPWAVRAIGYGISILPHWRVLLSEIRAREYA